MTYELNSLAELRLFAEALLPYLPKGKLIGLSGPLGAGKTELVRAIAKCLEAEDQVQSPSYVLELLYKVPERHADIAMEISHWDCFRLSPSEPTEEILEYLGSENQLIFIEWPRRITRLVDLLSVEITIDFPASGGDGRTVALSGDVDFLRNVEPLIEKALGLGDG